MQAEAILLWRWRCTVVWWTATIGLMSDASAAEQPWTCRDFHPGFDVQNSFFHHALGAGDKSAASVGGGIIWTKERRANTGSLFRKQCFPNKRTAGKRRLPLPQDYDLAALEGSVESNHRREHRRMQREVLLPHDEDVRRKLCDAIHHAQRITIAESNDLCLTQRLENKVRDGVLLNQN